MKNQKTLIILILLLLCIPMNTETEEVFIEEKVVLLNDMGKVYGSLLVPNITSETVALIISGSGPTDRDGNQPTLKNNSLKQLAHTLYQSDIASLRYDKRAIAESKIKDLTKQIFYLNIMWRMLLLGFSGLKNLPDLNKLLSLVTVKAL